MEDIIAANSIANYLVGVDQIIEALLIKRSSNLKYLVIFVLLIDGVKSFSVIEDLWQLFILLLTT